MLLRLLFFAFFCGSVAAMDSTTDRTINADQLKTFKQMALRGNENAQSLLINHFYELGKPTNDRNLLNQAKEWLTKKTILDERLKTIAFDIAVSENDTATIERFTTDAIMHDQQLLLHFARMYESRLHFDKASNLYKTFIKFQDPSQLSADKKMLSFALFHYAQSVINNEKASLPELEEATDLLKTLSKENTIALSRLAHLYNYGTKLTPADKTEAYKLYQRIIHLPDTPATHTTIEIAHDQLALLYEKGFGKQKQDFIKAKMHHERSPHLGGDLHIARLILSKKIAGDQIQAQELLKTIAENNDQKYSQELEPFAQYFYGTLLISLGKAEEAIPFLEKSAQGSLSEPLVYLQLGIAYYYGFGVAQNQKKASFYFNKIMKDTFSQFRSHSLAKGYLYLAGLDVKKNIKEGLRLIAESETKQDDVYFVTADILPSIEKMKLEQARKAQLLLLDEAPQIRKSKSPSLQKQATPRLLKKKSDNPSPAIALAVPVQDQQDTNPFAVTPDAWNKYFWVHDKSYVSAIDEKNKIFIIQDPLHHEQLTVASDALPDRSLTDITDLTFHKRILERQGKGATILHDETIYDHTFAQMLDYVIQYIGKLVPFVKSGGQKTDQLIALVTRKNLKTGKEVLCKAEYTFGQKDTHAYVYHRLLRPIKD